jgi:hypothetical protein
MLKNKKNIILMYFLIKNILYRFIKYILIFYYYYFCYKEKVGEVVYFYKVK